MGESGDIVRSERGGIGSGVRQPQPGSVGDSVPTVLERGAATRRAPAATQRVCAAARLFAATDQHLAARFGDPAIGMWGFGRWWSVSVVTLI